MSIYKVKFRDEKWIPQLGVMGPVDNAIIKGTQLKAITEHYSTYAVPVVSTIKFNPVNAKIDHDDTGEEVVKLLVLPRRAANFDKVKVVSSNEGVVTADYDNKRGEVTLKSVGEGRAYVHAFVDEPDVIYPEYSEYGKQDFDPSNTVRVDVYKGSMLTDAIRITPNEDSSFNYQDGAFHIAEGVYMPIEQLVNLKEFRDLGNYDGEHIDSNVEVLPSNERTVVEVMRGGKETLHFKAIGTYDITVRSKAFPDVKTTVKVKVYKDLADIPKQQESLLEETE